MDGMPRILDLPTMQPDQMWTGNIDALTVQRTLRNPISCVGIGLHSGLKIEMYLEPAEVGAGIVFRRADIDGGAAEIAARFDQVVDTRLCTVLAHPARPEVRVGTTEHLLAALAGCGVRNAIVTVDGPEVPILDGSAASFVFLIDCAGVVDQDEPFAAIEVLRPVRVTQGEAYCELLPGGPGLDMSMSIDFNASVIGAQSLSISLSSSTFRGALSRARTFTLARDVEALRMSGLALGGSLDNAIVVEGEQVLNPGGLRMRDEFVRHKLLDAVGDLSLAGACLQGRFVGHRSGHTLNNRLIRALFADDANWSPVASPNAFSYEGTSWATRPLGMAAASV